MFIRNYSRENIILEDDYQEALKVKFDEDQHELDLAERVIVIQRTISVAKGIGLDISSRQKNEENYKSIIKRNMSYNAPNGDFSISLMQGTTRNSGTA